ncbi:MAG: recombinase family protein [Planctomycetota bacterium]
MGARRCKSRAAETPREVRCAVYTRKSTEEGLDQEFNSLDAQREAAEAYIASQKQEGWLCLPDRYDDGGFSGATLERPGLARLLQDIEAGKVQCVVVYKVDRLSRSLLDFTRLIDLFDQKKASFVSITQQFQTTTSMGRLTLNVLLSFAQFEREMIAERTRDKMGAARRKGKWVGGFPILGYDLDPEGGRLHVNAEEAEQVQAIFALYLRRRSLSRVLRELDQRGWRTKRWTTRKGKVRGGSRFSKSGLSHLLQHAYYVGKVRYRGETYAGEHEAIVDEKVFERVQRCLRRKTGAGGHRPKQPSGALLMGILECGACQAPMTPGYTAKSKRRYRYYRCTRALREGNGRCPSPSLPAQEVEDYVVARLRAFGRREGEEQLLNGAGPERIAQARACCEALDSAWDASDTRDRRAVLRHALRRIAYDGGAGTMLLALRSDLAADSGSDETDGNGNPKAHEVNLRTQVRIAGGSRQRRSKRHSAVPEGKVPRVARLMALALHFDRLLGEGVVRNYAELARRSHVTRARITQIMNLLNLAPDLQEKLLCLPRTLRGRDPVTEQKVRAVAALVCWDRQRGAISGILPGGSAATD